MKKNLNKKFILALQEKLPEKASLPKFIMETLKIGKEATYRRLRGDVPFTFDEIAILAESLKISLDRLVGNYSENSALFNFNMVQTHHTIEDYENTLMRYINYLSQIKDDPEGYIIHILNTLSYSMYSPYKYLSRFRICRWLHQTEQLTAKELSEIEIPFFIRELQKS